jgi:hypothetical protein
MLYALFYVVALGEYLLTVIFSNSDALPGNQPQDQEAQEGVKSSNSTTRDGYGRGAWGMSVIAEEYRCDERLILMASVDCIATARPGRCRVM